MYELCYLEPQHFSGGLWQKLAKPGRKSNGKLNDRAEWPSKILTKCSFPHSHLSLGSVCCQVRNEYFPIFARHHVFSFSHPLVFANEYLSYTPPYRYSNIRHLAIDWLVATQNCSCETSHWFCPSHVAKDVNVVQDMRNVLKMVDIYPELFNSLESIRLRLSSASPAHIPPPMYEKADNLFKYAILLVEKMDQVRHNGNPSLEERKFILAVHFNASRLSKGSYQINVLAVSDKTWDVLTNAAVLHRKTDGCQESKNSPDALSAVTHYPRLIDWTNVDAFNKDVCSGMLYHKDAEDTDVEEASEIPAHEAEIWKVVFEDENVREPSLFVMKEISAARNQKRKPARHDARKTSTT